MNPQSTPDKFWSKVYKTKHCWFWLAARLPDGRGILTYQAKRWSAPRLAWTLTFNRDVKTKWVLHTCDNPNCVNPNHLYLGNRIQNIKDMVDRGRTCTTNSFKTHCPKGHLYSKTNTWIGVNESGGPHRRCRICNNLNQIKVKSKKRREQNGSREQPTV